MAHRRRRTTVFIGGRRRTWVGRRRSPKARDWNFSGFFKRWFYGVNGGRRYRKSG